MIENQFNESVQRSLFQTVILVEENEALQYLAQTLDGYNYKTSVKGINTIGDKISTVDSVADKLQLNSNKFNKPAVQLSTGHGKATIQETSKFLQEKFKQNFLH